MSFFVPASDASERAPSPTPSPSRTQLPDGAVLVAPTPQSPSPAPLRYSPPQLRTLGTLTDATGMAVTEFTLPETPLR